MTVDTVLYSHLSGDATLAGLVGDRIYPDIAPQGVTVPFIVRRLIDESRESGMGADLGIVHARHQFDVYASSHAQRRTVMDALRGALQRWASPTANPPVWDALIENRQELFEDETALYRGILDVMIHHGE